jgi:tetratricopeptide (TPR) repeat protein
VPNPVPWSDYSADQVEQLLAALLIRMIPTAQRIDGSGGDGGVDVQVPVDGGWHIYEIKRFAGRLTRTQQRQIEKSLHTAVSNQADMVAWTLVVPVDFTPAELGWFTSDLQRLSPVPIMWMGRTTIETHLSEHRDLLRTFAPGSVEARALDLTAETLGWRAGRGALKVSRRVGLVPAPANSFQGRDGLFDNFPLGDTVVLSGLGGVGKTQVAADYARVQAGDTTVIWVTATSRDLIRYTYAEAARILFGPHVDIEQAASRFLCWLATTEQAWLVVIDDLQAPADMKRLWPQGTAGRTIVTTRRRDAALAGQRRRILDVDVFTPQQANQYLRSALHQQQLGDDVDGVGADLRGLPLALAQAAAFMLDRQLPCSQYRRRFADQRRRLSELLPEPEALPDDHHDTVATTWLLSMEAANRLAPAGLARPLMQILSVLDPDGIPAGIFTEDASRNWLSHAIQSATESSGDIDAEAIRDGLRTLYRLSLLQQEHETVRIHALVQRVAREELGAHRRGAIVRAGADALLSSWRREGRTGAFDLTMRANVDALCRHDQDELIKSGVHKVLILAGIRQSEAGDPRGTAKYFDALLTASVQHLGSDHPDVLELRGNAARALATSEPAGAISIHEDLVREFTRVRGPDDAGTIVARANLAVCRAQAGALSNGIHDMEKVLADCERLFGPRSVHTLDARGLLANMYGEAGANDVALAMLAQIAADRRDLLGPDHRETLAAQGAYARWLIENGDPATAIALLQQLLDVRTERLGPDHPDTLATRVNLAQAFGKSGKAKEAAVSLKAVLADFTRVMGLEHPATVSVRNNYLLHHSLGMDPDDAANAWMDLIDDSKRVLGQLAPETLNIAHNFGEWLALKGYYDQAAGWLQIALDGRTQVLGPHHPHTVATGAYLAQVREAMT